MRSVGDFVKDWLWVRALVVFVLGILLFGCRTIDERIDATCSYAELAQATADYYVEDGEDESCSVTLVVPSGTFYGNAGMATEHSLFRIASLSKLFLFPAAMRLHEQGRVDLNRPVTDYTHAKLPPEFTHVTGFDLLQNKSGLPREFLRPSNPMDMAAAFWCGFTGSHLYADFDTRQDFVRECWRPQWREAVRRGKPTYSNMGFGLFGIVLEDALDQPLESILQQAAVKPLGLQDTTYEPETGVWSNRLTRACAGHLPWLTRRRQSVPDHRLGDALRATGGLFSSTYDCARAFGDCWRFIDEHMKRQPLSACSDGELYGALRVKVLLSGRRVLYRAGMIYGGASFVGFDPVDRTIVIILRNVTSWPDTRGFRVMSRCADLRRQEGTVNQERVGQ